MSDEGIKTEIAASESKDEIEDAEQLEEIFSLYEHLEVMFDEKRAALNKKLDAVIAALPAKEEKKLEEEIKHEALTEVIVEKPEPKVGGKKWRLV